jgi:hypothetical protein
VLLLTFWFIWIGSNCCKGSNIWSGGRVSFQTAGCKYSHSL